MTDYATTGDGLMAGLQFLPLIRVMAECEDEQMLVDVVDGIVAEVTASA